MPVMHLYHIENLGVKHGYHTTPATVDPTEAPSSPDFSQPLSRIDRGSAVVLGVLLVTILIAVGWFCSVKIKQKEVSAEQRMPRKGTTAIERSKSIGGEIPRFSTDKLFFTGQSSESRADSEITTLVGSGSVIGFNGRNEEEEKIDRSWPGVQPSSGPRRQLPPPCSAASKLQAPGDHRSSVDRTRSISPLSQATPVRNRSVDYPIQRHASHHRRQSSARSIDVYIPTRRAAFSQTQYDNRWWSEVASHGGCTARANRRLLTLAPILEPEAAPQAGSFDDLYVCDCGRRSIVPIVDRQAPVSRIDQ